MKSLRYIFMLVALCGFAVMFTSPALAQGGPGPGRGRGPGPGPGPGPAQRDAARDTGRIEEEIDTDRPGRGPRLSPEAQRDLDDFWDKNKQKIIDFCKEHSPNRWRAFERRLGDVRFRAPRDRLLLQLKHLMELEKADPELYKIKIAQIHTEDAEYRLSREINWAKDRAQADDLQKKREELRATAREAIGLRLQERQLRLARLQKRFEAENQRLAKEMANMDSIIDARVEEVIRNPPGPPPMRRQQTTSQPGATQ
jgi:hypothetical protein